MIEELQPEVMKITHVAASQMKEEKYIYRLLKCFKSWIMRETPREIKKDLHHHKVVELALGHMHDDNMTEYAVEVLHKIIKICQSPQTYSELYEMLLAKFSEGLQQ
jgi:hypothetical protein